ncbi:MAG: hypothetical protein R2737_17540 [Candidatus Nanopelagicales bacterium]
MARFVNRYRPIRGFSYEPAPSDNARKNPTRGPGGNQVYFDSDYYNEDFRQLWGPGGRDDLRKMASIDSNFLHIYNWNPYRDHGGFLDYAERLGIGVTIPISNYTNCLIIGNGCDGVATGSYAAAYANIERIFEEIYLPGADHKPHPAAAIWGVYNEFDYVGISPESVLFVIAAIVDLERKYDVPPQFRLPIFVSTSTGPYAGGAQGVGPTLAVSRVLEESAKSDQPRTWVGKDGKQVVLGPIPDGFWQSRYVASTNPFQNAIALNTLINQTWPAAFPGGDRWNDLPPMFFGEMGFAYPDSQEGQRVRDQLRCTYPMSRDSASPGGYFLGAAMFEFTQEDLNGQWGVWTFFDPSRFTTASIQGRGGGASWIPGGTYRVDELKDRPTWEAIEAGFHAREQDCMWG